VEKVGFVGLGIMGAYMAGNLLEAGHELVVHNRTRTKAEQLAQHGARVADSPREVAESSDVVITMLPGPPEVDEVVAGEALAFCPQALEDDHSHPATQSVSPRMPLRVGRSRPSTAPRIMPHTGAVAKIRPVLAALVMLTP
jgi:hypothetical protein